MKNKYALTKENHFLVVTESDGYESPNDWRNTDIFLVYDHRQFCIEREGFDAKEIFEYLQNCADSSTIDLRNDDYDKYWIFPVYAYIHSGVSLSLGKDTYPFTCKFDTSMQGFILVLKDATEEGRKPVICTEDEATKYAEGLIETWNQYLSGEVYSFVVIETVKCPHCGTIEEIEHDSCCGFYGELNDDLLNEMIMSTEYSLTSYEPQEAQA